MVILYGMVPVDFCRGIIIPVVKNSKGNKTSSDNYTVSQKTRHQTLGRNFTNYYPIFKIFFTNGLSSKFAINSCLNILPRFKHVATLPCEI